MSGLRRDVWLLRRTDGGPARHVSWGCVVESVVDGVEVRIDGPGDVLDVDLERPAEALHDRLLGQIPGGLLRAVRVEVGAVRTTSEQDRRQDLYALVTCANAVVTLVDHLWPEPATSWGASGSPAERHRDLPVVLGPSAVLSLVAAVLELSARSVPAWLTARPTTRSPYPPHDCPPWIEEPLASSLVAPEQWLRPMRTTRNSRGRYHVDTTLPPAGDPRAAVRVVSLVSLDTTGQCWQATLAADLPGERQWLTQPVSVELGANDLLAAVTGQLGAPEPALDRDPVDGEAFGWAPPLLTGLTADSLLTAGI